jgi:outer membrane protein assembly factor BamA
MKKPINNTQLLATLMFGAIALQANTAQADETVAYEANTYEEQPKWIIDGISCEGNKNTECDFITKKYYQQVGDVLDAEEIADAKLRLGTLIQFKTVNTRLKKGQERGHVVVVFEVSEANHIQYELGLGFNYAGVGMDDKFCSRSWGSTECESQNGHSSGPAYSAAITDFNFLGTGKRLSFSANNAEWSNKFNYDVVYYRDNGEEYSYSGPGQRNSISGATLYSLTYHDPHLFDSTNYFFTARVNSASSSQRYNDRIHVDQQEPILNQDNRPFQEGNSYLEIGRRFSSHSFASVDLSGFDGFGFNYGWDSQDNSLFPTQGSLFTSTVRHGPEEGYYVQASQLTTNFSVRYTSINAFNRMDGTYSG